MLNPDPILDTLVASLQSITSVVAAMGGSPEKIAAHHDYYGAEFSLAETIAKLIPPAILVCYDGSQGGNFDGTTIFKHRFLLYLRLANQAQALEPLGYGGLWRKIISDGPVKGYDGIAGPHIRAVQVFEGLDLMDTPTLARRQDEDLMDYFVGSFVFPEIGDN